ADLVKQLMTFSRKSRMVKTSIDVNRLIQEVGKLIKSTFDRKIEFSIQGTPIDSKISGDINQLHQVLLNMCFNARDALMDVADDPDRKLAIVISASEIQITERLIEAELRSGYFVCITVSDTGKGISPDVVKHIFEPFFTTKEVGSGTGLGLSTAFGIIRQHDGWITVYSEPGIGTTFRIYLPTSRDELQHLSSGLTDETVLPRGNELILLVDDEPMIRRIGQTMLEKLGYRVAVAGNGKEALELHQRMPQEYGLILLDLSMPIMSGREFLEQCKSLPHRPKIIVSSGISTNTLGADLLSMVDGFVTKPYRLVDLAKTVRNVLDVRN
ncbi:MAG: ATP-binding protein, partial [bacterium]|nr:ATP-binding protein [bacterium]